MSASAGPKVIFDSGKTVPITPYMESLNAEPTFRATPVAAPSFFPISTPKLSIGKVKNRSVDLPFLTTPLFIVGSDQTSQRWLIKNKKALQQMGAMGMLVNAASESELKSVMKAGKGLKITPASGTGLVSRFKLKHYPALITKKTISQ